MKKGYSWVSFFNKQNFALSIIFRPDEIKKHCRTSHEVPFQEFSLTKQKTRPRADYERIGKTIS